MRRAVARVMMGARQRSLFVARPARAYPPWIWRELSQRKSRICVRQISQEDSVYRNYRWQRQSANPALAETM